MNVAVGEARQQEPLAGIDYFRCGAAQRVDLLALADRDDLVTSNRDRLRPLLLCIYGVDAGVGDDHVGGFGRRIRRHQSWDREESREEECDAQTREGKGHSLDFLYLECRRSVDPQQPGLAPAGIFPVMRRGALKIKAVAALQMVLLAVKRDLQFAAEHE